MRQQMLNSTVSLGSKSLRQAESSYIHIMVSRMTTELMEPDHVVLDLFQPGNAMYLIAKGECQVSISD